MNGPNSAGTRYLKDGPEGIFVAVVVGVGGGTWSTTPGSYWDDWREQLAFDPGLVVHLIALQEAETALSRAIRHLNWDTAEYQEIRATSRLQARVTKDYCENRWPYKDAPSGTIILCPVEHLEVYWVRQGRSFMICDVEMAGESLVFLDEMRVLVP